MAHQPNRLTREKKIDEALAETFPASDTPWFVAAGAEPKAVAPPKGQPAQQSDKPSDSDTGGSSTAEKE
jgi:hypothetical protein